MPFDPTLPANNSEIRSPELRSQFNALNDQDAAIDARIDQTDANVATLNQRINDNESGDIVTNARIDQTNADVTATNSRIDNLPVGVSFPYDGSGEVTQNFTTGGNQYVQGELGLGMTAGGSSAETGLKIAAENTGEGLIPRFTGRNSGSDQGSFAIDGCGFTGNMGTPSVQHGDLLAADTTGGSARWKPTRGLAARFADLMPLNITDENPNIQAIATRLDEYLARFQAM